MKKHLLNFLLVIFKYHLKVIYFFMKIFTKQKKQVFFLSRQFSFVPLNYQLLIDKLEQENVSYKVICKKVTNDLNSLIRNEDKKSNLFKELKGIISYYFNLYKQMHYCATSSVIIVDGYNVTASLLKHKKDTIVIQMWHALAAIKKFGYQTIGMKDGLNPKTAEILCMHKNYDYVISGSKAMNKDFAEAFNVDEKIVIPCGTPMVDYLKQGNDKEVKKIYKKYPQLKKKINILYSPTFRSDGSDNLEEVINSIDTKKYNLILTFHPKNNEIKTSKDVITINPSEFLTFDILRVADYVITDYSALMIDACVLNKRILLYVYDYEKYNEENGINIDLFKELKGNVSKDIKEIINIIDKEKYNDKTFNTFKDKYTPKVENSTEVLYDLIKEAL